MAQSLGSLLKGHRASAGLTQEELAERAEVSARTISDAERGLRTRIYRDTAGRLADALQLDDMARKEFEDAARGRPSTVARTAAALPVPLTRLIGREQELHVVLEALAKPEVRLLTVTGPGGIGKTRIALAAADRADTRFFVQLGNVSDPRLVIPVIARAVGISGAKEATVDTLAERLRGERALIVLDTFEHVLGAAPDIAMLLSACGDLTVLATSREALRIQGEHEMAIPTLDIPTSATALFVERARAVKPGLTLDGPAAELVAEICRRVNGLPLAIELAAARVKHMGLTELRDHLDNRLSVLTGGGRDLPRRQRTMRDTVAWSYELLNADEQALFLDLSVFAGGWTLEAAEAVCAADDVLAGLSALVDKSLVFLLGTDERRYGMLDMICEFAGELRTSDEAERRHLAYFLSLAERAEPELGGATQHDWMRRLSSEHDNIRAALSGALRRRDGDTALSLAGGVWRFWLLHGDLSEGRGLLHEALALDAAAAPLARAKALWGAAWLAYHQGDYEAARSCGEQLQPIAQAFADPVQSRNALTIHGIVAMAHARYDEAVAAMSESVALLRDVGPEWLLATSLLNLGMASLHARDDARAQSALDEARAIYLDLGDQYYGARAVLYSGYAALLRGDRRLAALLFGDSLVTFWELDDLWGTTEALEGVVSIAAAEGRAEEAATIAGAAEALRERINARPFPSDRAVMERSLDRIRSSITPEAWAAARRAGETTSADEAVDRALDITSATPHRPASRR